MPATQIPNTAAQTTYIQGFVIAVPAANRPAYLEHARASASLFEEHGAICVKDAWGDDVPTGELTDFGRSVKAGSDEAIVFSWHEYPSKDAARKAYAAAMADPRMERIRAATPFDVGRMIYGGFATLFEKRAERGARGAGAYIDGSLLAVPTNQQATYQAVESELAAVILEHGATRIVDAWGDEVPTGDVTDFPRSVRSTEDETVVFSWIEWPTKAVRDEAWRRIFADPRMHASDTPYDGRRRVHGGFAMLG